MWKIGRDSHRQVKSEMRHNRQALRWVVLAVIIILLAVASFSYFAHRREAAAEGQGPAQALQTPAIDSQKH